MLILSEKKAIFCFTEENAALTPLLTQQEGKNIEAIAVKGLSRALLRGTQGSDKVGRHVSPVW